MHYKIQRLLLALIGLSMAVFAANINNSTDGEEFDTINSTMYLSNAPTWSVRFKETKLNMTMTQKTTMELEIFDIDTEWGEDYQFHIVSGDEELINIQATSITAKDIAAGQNYWKGNFTIEALFLGRVPVYVQLIRPNASMEKSIEELDILVQRKMGVIDDIFKIVVGTFVMLLYVNFGAVLELDALKRILLKPIGPAIGFVGQFLVMPLLSFAIGYFLFHDMIELRLGLFFTGSTPGGGASNIFTVILNGNLNLSITMTAISNLAAFGMMPLWLFTLGALIFKDGNLVVPYQTIATMSFSLVLPLAIGISLQKYFPNITNRIARLLKPVSLVLIIVITIFAFTVNSYMFKLFSLKVSLGYS